MICHLSTSKLKGGVAPQASAAPLSSLLLVSLTGEAMRKACSGCPPILPSIPISPPSLTPWGDPRSGGASEAKQPSERSEDVAGSGAVGAYPNAGHLVKSKMTKLVPRFPESINEPDITGQL